ncbi:MAG: sulfite exporter TauE/SafE family protein, partial [Bacteroidetes bacterium]
MQGILSSLLPAQWIALAICALCVGMSKTGVAGIYAVVVPLMAAVFGGKLSTGVLLPILIIGDVFAVIYYHREANWGYIRRLLPWTMAGVLVGTLTGSAISDGTFKIMMAFVILSGIAVMFLMDLRKQQDVPAHPAIGAATGLLGGFATMIGNVA